MDTTEGKELIKTIKKLEKTKFNIEFRHLKDVIPIANGNFGEIYVAKYKTNKVALKKIVDIVDERLHKYYIREIQTLQDLHHPNIVKYIGLCKNTKGLYIVMEYVEGGDLFSLLSSTEVILSWEEKLNFALDVAKAVFYLHSKNVVHRDLKSKNILVRFFYF